MQAQPLERPPNLCRLLELCGIEDFCGDLGAMFACPLCCGLPPDHQPSTAAPIVRESLRVFLNVHNEVVLRCHACGFAGSGLDLLAHRIKNWDEIREQLVLKRVFDDEPVPEHWVQRAQFWKRFAPYFEQAKANYRYQQRFELLPGRFGEIGSGFDSWLHTQFPEVGLTREHRKVRLFLELRRSLLGLPLEVAVVTKEGNQLASYQIHPPEPISLVVPEWALWRDWTEEIILTTGQSAAVRLQLAGATKTGKCPPVAWIYNANGSVLDEIPFRQIRFVHDVNQSPEFALAFAHGSGHVTVAACPDGTLPQDLDAPEREAVQVVAEQIVTVQSQGINPLAYLDNILDKPWIAGETAYRLTHAVALRLGACAEALVSRSMATKHVLPFIRPEATYLCRHGVYHRASDRKRRQFVPCSNFSLKILESSIQPEEEGGGVVHRLRLTLGTHAASFGVPEEDFRCGHRLLQQATRAAVERRFSTLPWMSHDSYIPLLPALIKATQLPKVTLRQRSELGWKAGTFHGPNFTVNAWGVRHFLTSPPDNCRHWLKAEDAENLSVSGEDYLRTKANELGTWLSRLSEAEQRQAGALLFATLSWLHQGFRGRDSFLLVPSRQHLDALGELCGFIPIEIGRTSSNPWAPKLMASHFWKPDKFRLHGHIVAAIEAPERRIDPSLAMVVHHLEQPLPAAPTSFLSLFVYACLGVRNTGQAIMKLSRPAESADLQHQIERLLTNGSWYLAHSGRYLDCFLEAVRRHFGHGDLIIESGRGPLLDRRVIIELCCQFHYGFRETRIIEEFRRATGLPQPARYGKGQVSAFALTEELVAASKSPTWDDDGPNFG